MAHAAPGAGRRRLPPPPSAGRALADVGTPVKSPMVGSFYASPQPGEPAFVKVGDKVKADSTVCLVEAMKFFNLIKADVAGTITKILAKDGDAVEFGQTLFLGEAGLTAFAGPVFANPAPLAGAGQSLGGLNHLAAFEDGGLPPQHTDTLH